jgi:formate hydrogenlyase subunit 4
MKWGISLRQTVAAALLIGVFVPFGAAFSLAPLPIFLGIIILVAKLLAVFIALSFLENTMARIRILDSTRFTYVAAGAAMLAFAFSLAGI